MPSRTDPRKTKKSLPFEKFVPRPSLSERAYFASHPLQFICLSSPRPSSVKLAVVIPAYKETYFERTLESLAAQTDRRFTVYVGDDHSPANLKAVVDRFRDRLDLRYTRFPDNIGAKHLVKQWARCMTLVQDEAWVWFFSDDDLASRQCVETFYRHVATTRADVYRFNTCTIDANDKVTGPTVPSPDYESSEEMALNLLLGRRGNSMPDHVFSRDVYERKGGFVYTPFAQAADWATSILFSQEKGMHMLQEGTVHWRRAGTSISSNVSKHRAETILGHYRFIEWLLQHFEYLKTRPSPTGITYEQMRSAALQNLHDVLVFHYRGIPPRLYFKHLRLVQKHFAKSLVDSADHLAGVIISRLRHDRYERRRLATQSPAVG